MNFQPSPTSTQPPPNLPQSRRHSRSGLAKLVNTYLQWDVQVKAVPESSPHPRMSAEDRRRQLLDVAIDLFSKRGFGGTTTREIAQAAGVTEAIIFRHFATKQDLYAAILDHATEVTGLDIWLAQLQDYMDREDDAGLFRSIIARIIEIHRTEPRFERLMLHASLEGHELAVMHRNQIMSLIGVRLHEYIERRQQAGALRDCDPRTIIFAVVGTAQFFGIQKYMYQLCDIPQPDEEVTELFASILMKGVQK
jgi:TetR/AcrR family transcriptional regulator